MCAPDFFGVDYVINPWMEGQKGHVDRAAAVGEWNRLRDALAEEAELVFLEPRQGLPDLVFTANAGMVMGAKAVVSRFHAPERQGEEPYFRGWFKANGFALAPWPRNLSFEGAGDALLDRGQPVIWAAHGFRSGETAAPLLEKFFQREVETLSLTHPRFYHLDTCFCPLPEGYLLYYPAAFDAASQNKIARRVPVKKRIPVEDADALAFACNAVDLNGRIFMNDASGGLQKKLRGAGFESVIAPVAEFMKSGGAVKCLTLKLVEA